MTTVHTSLRVEDKSMNAIDRARSKRHGNISRNTWIAEAIAEKLVREDHSAKFQENA